jgi:hypothetical protein
MSVDDVAPEVPAAPDAAGAHPNDRPAGVQVSALWLPLSGWALQVATGAGGRRVLELYAGEHLVDVCVAEPIDAVLIRGAFRGGAAQRGWSLVWGQVAGASGARVTFRTERTARPVRHRTAARPVAEGFWVAEVAGHFRTALVSAGPARVIAPITAHRLDS